MQKKTILFGILGPLLVSGGVGSVYAGPIKESVGIEENASCRTRMASPLPSQGVKIDARKLNIQMAPSRPSVASLTKQEEERTKTELAKTVSWQNIREAAKGQPALQGTHDKLWTQDSRGRWVKLQMNFQKEVNQYNGWLKDNKTLKQSDHTQDLLTQLTTHYKDSLDQSRRTWRGDYSRTSYSPYRTFGQKMRDLKELETVQNFSSLNPRQTEVLLSTLMEPAIAFRSIIQSRSVTQEKIEKALERYASYGYPTAEKMKSDIQQYQNRHVELPYMLEKGGLFVNVLNQLSKELQHKALNQLVLTQKRTGVLTTKPLTLDQVQTFAPGLKIKLK